MLDPKNAVFPPKTAASSFPGAGWEHQKRGAAVTQSAGRAKGNHVVENGSSGEGHWRKEAAMGGG